MKTLFSRGLIPPTEIKQQVTSVELMPETEPLSTDGIQPNGPKPMLPYSSLYVFSPVNP